MRYACDTRGLNEVIVRDLISNEEYVLSMAELKELRYLKKFSSTAFQNEVYALEKVMTQGICELGTRSFQPNRWGVLIEEINADSTGTIYLSPILNFTHIRGEIKNTTIVIAEGTECKHIVGFGACAKDKSVDVIVKNNMARLTINGTGLKCRIKDKDLAKLGIILVGEDAEFHIDELDNNKPMVLAQDTVIQSDLFIECEKFDMLNLLSIRKLRESMKIHLNTQLYNQSEWFTAHVKSNKNIYLVEDGGLLKWLLGREEVKCKDYYYKKRKCILTLTYYTHSLKLGTEDLLEEVKSKGIIEIAGKMYLIDYYLIETVQLVVTIYLIDC